MTQFVPRAAEAPVGADSEPVETEPDTLLVVDVKLASATPHAASVAAKPPTRAPTRSSRRTRGLQDRAEAVVEPATLRAG